MSRLPAENYQNILAGLKDKIRQARLRTALNVNAELLQVYWEIGNSILEQQKDQGWGAKVIARLASDLKTEFPDMKGLSERNLVYMQTFCAAYPHFPFTQAPPAQLNGIADGNRLAQPKVALTQGIDFQSNTNTQPLVAKIPWTHHTIILDKIKDSEERCFYLQKTLENGWTKSVLKLQIESRLYERQGKAITNFSKTLPPVYSEYATDTLKSPYVIDFLSITEEMKERDIERGLIQHLKKFMLELGRGFAYVGNQKNLVVEGDDFFLDLLFYNYNLQCFVIFELKVGDFKPEFAGKLNFYVNTVNEQIKDTHHKPTIGVLLCKTPNKTVIEYSLKGIESPIGVADYELVHVLPKELKGEIPSVAELEAEIEKEYEELKEPLKEGVDKIKSLLADLKGEKVSKRRDRDTVIALYDSVFFPLYNRIKQLLKETFGDYFESIELTVSPHSGTNTPENLRQYLHSNDHIQHLKLFVQLKGFRHAGTDVFSLENKVEIDLDEYKYTCRMQQNNDHRITKLYHQILSSEELNTFATEVCKTFLDETARRIEAIKEQKT